jgi:hypothetical protein
MHGHACSKVVLARQASTLALDEPVLATLLICRLMQCCVFW